MSIQKKCTTCKVVKSLEHFNKNKSKSDGLNSLCRDCSNARSRQYYRQNPEKHRSNVAAYKKSNYARTRAQSLGLNTEDVEQAITLSDGKCGVCKRKRVLVIDHDHVTMKVRGLLCITCNTGIGKLGDNVEGLQKALQYLYREVA